MTNEGSHSYIYPKHLNIQSTWKKHQFILFSDMYDIYIRHHVCTEVYTSIRSINVISSCICRELANLPIQCKAQYQSTTAIYMHTQ